MRSNVEGILYATIGVGGAVLASSMVYYYLRRMADVEINLSLIIALIVAAGVGRVLKEAGL